MTPDQARAVNRVAGFRQSADGSYSANAESRTELDDAVRAARDADCDVSVFVHGLSAETLAVCAQEICDLAIDEGVAIRFRHRDRVIRLEVDLDVPGGADLVTG